MLLLVIVAFALLVFWLVGVRFFVDGWQSSRTSLALKILFPNSSDANVGIFVRCLSGGKSSSITPTFSLSVVREEKKRDP